jgi:hypothetical protein
MTIDSAEARGGGDVGAVNWKSQRT